MLIINFIVISDQVINLIFCSLVLFMYSFLFFTLFFFTETKAQAGLIVVVAVVAVLLLILLLVVFFCLKKGTVTNKLVN